MFSAVRPSLFAIAALAATCVAQSKTLQQPIAWTIHADEWQLAKGQVQLSLTARSEGASRSQQSHSIPLASLEGVPAQAFASQTARDVSFRLVRQAGRLDCSGVVRARAGAGECRFIADARFVSELQRRGIGRPDELQLYHLTVSGANLAVLDELARHGYPQPDIEDLVKLGIFSVGPGYVRELAASGYKLGSIEDLVKFKIFDITPGYIAELAAIGPGFRALPADKLVEYRIHKISPETIRSLAALGYDDLDREAVTQFAIFKVTPQFIRELRELGYADLSPGQLVELRIHGVTPEYIRGIARAGIARPGVDQLKRLRMAGFDPARRDEDR